MPVRVKVRVTVVRPPLVHLIAAPIGFHMGVPNPPGSREA